MTIDNAPDAVPREWREALRFLAFTARTTGGTAGPDSGLKEACERAEALLARPYRYPSDAWPDPRPMSEAPRDAVVLAWWPESRDWLFTQWQLGRECWIHELECGDPQPTCWLPMPPEPAEQEVPK